MHWMGSTTAEEGKGGCNNIIMWWWAWMWNLFTPNSSAMRWSMCHCDPKCCLMFSCFLCVVICLCVHDGTRLLPTAFACHIMLPLSALKKYCNIPLLLAIPSLLIWISLPYLRQLLLPCMTRQNSGAGWITWWKATTEGPQPPLPPCNKPYILYSLDHGNALSCSQPINDIQLNQTGIAVIVKVYLKLLSIVSLGQSP